MWIRLKKSYALVYPPRVEPAGSVHSVGGPRGAELIRRGIAEETTEPPEQDVTARNVRNKRGAQPAKLDRARAIEILVKAAEVSRRK